jgi:hypothetical protein
MASLSNSFYCNLNLEEALSTDANRAHSANTSHDNFLLDLQLQNRLVKFVFLTIAAKAKDCLCLVSHGERRQGARSALSSKDRRRPDLQVLKYFDSK